MSRWFLAGIIPVPIDFQAEIGFTELQCGLLERAGLLGEIPPEFCVDDLRLSLDLRQNCDCPPIPDVPPPVNAPITMPTTVPAPIVRPVANVTAVPMNVVTITPITVVPPVPTNFPTSGRNIPTEAFPTNAQL
jgi:hypothetical protein